VKYLIVYAHPEPRSLNAALKDHAVAELTRAGHEVEVSDLYAMKWKASADGDDFPERDAAERLVYHRASGDAFHGGTQSPDVAAEQAKLLRADAVILQFPLWWFSMPAIMKGWVDRVFAHGFAIGVPRPGSESAGSGTANGAARPKWARYGEGTLAGRRGMVAITTGARGEQFGPRGLNGPLEDVLFPITRGTLFYTGLVVVPSFVVYRTVRLPEREFRAVGDAYVQRLLTIGTTEPIPYRTENGGDFADGMTLNPEVGAGEAGLSLYRRREPG
jgi:NAD(P)H dehydrogenase (quinone)